MIRRNGKASARAAIGAVAAAVVLTGCATKSDIRSLQEEVRGELRAQAARQDSLIMLMRFQTETTQDTLRTQSNQLFDFRGDITRLLQSMSQSLVRLEALVGENQRGIAQLRAQGGGGPVVGVVPGPVGGAPVAPPVGSETVSGVAGANAGQLYDVARDQHMRGSLSAAQQAYEQFLEEFPGDDRAPDAQFFLADVLAQQGRPEDALEALLEIPTLYPTAARVPEALYRAARIQADLGDTDGARTSLERIVNTYPDSVMALVARDMLEELG